MTNYAATNVDLTKAPESMSRWRGACTYPNTKISASYISESSLTELAQSPLSTACLFNEEIAGSFCDDLYPDDETISQLSRLPSFASHKHANMDTVVDIDIDVDFDFSSNIEINFDAADINTEMRYESKFQEHDSNIREWYSGKNPVGRTSDMLSYETKTDSTHESYLKIFEESSSSFLARDSLVISMIKSSEDRPDSIDFIMDYDQVLSEFESWSDGIDYGSISDSQPTLIQDPINISFDIEIIGKSCHENWFDAVERRYIQEVGFY